MAYVPGYQHDIFVSYAHGDDSAWINRLIDRLEPALTQRLGTKVSVWLDDDDLRRSLDFSRQIPESVKSSALFLLFPSPTYIRSKYCVDQECRLFAETLAARRTRFSGKSFANDLFALRCPIVPVDGNEHWSLFPGLTDVPFCDEVDTFAPGSPAYESSLRRLVGEAVDLLKRMRNHSTSVFLYPPHPGPDLKSVRDALAAELSAHTYRTLPDRTLNLPDQLREASLSVFLLGADYEDSAGELAELAASQKDKPWVAWCSPTLENAGPDQRGFGAYLEQLDSSSKTFLNMGILPAKLKEEVLGLLRPDPYVLPETQGKPRVYLVYNARDQLEKTNAGLISFHFRKQFHFDHPDDPAQHTVRLSRSDGVLLVWGNAGEDWCSREFMEMVQTGRRTGGQGLCLFDPKETKSAAVQEIRKSFGDLYIGEQFGKFDPSQLATFFTPLLRRSAGTLR